ncbi:hypothetical protein HGRIS_002282 [Hohenbuehelia grisea]|uniref:SWIM-type domain-containing protein n=1 Tax=Hohenbuehelia grisea TaxID=104357 RepID=A0ABR3JK07_9AGAR
MTRLIGYLTHNDECKKAVLTRIPAVPLHEHVYNVALEQLRNGASIAAVQAKNRDMLSKALYRGQAADIDANANANVRYTLLPSDNATLYCKFSRLYGVNIRNAPEYNLDNWLDPSSPDFKPVLREAIFYYMPRMTKEERLKVCISTAEMDEAAWKYGHQSQIILDGTFGICSVRMLLFITLAVDEDGKGVPLAFLLFSAPTGNRATHAGYNTEILQELLSKWQQRLSNTRRRFTPAVAITDTDTKERKKLLPSTTGVQFWREHVVSRLKTLEIQLIKSINHKSAELMIETEQCYLQQLETSAESQRAAQAGLRFLEHLKENWMPISLWQSWSQCGRLSAAAALNIPVEATTNHLEAFNFILKRKHLQEWLHSGHRLRFESLINFLICEILPGIFANRQAKADYARWLVERFRPFAGGVDLIAASSARRAEGGGEIKLVWWSPDTNRDRQALEIIGRKLLGNIYRGTDNISLVATCISSAAQVSDPACQRYLVSLSPSGLGSCSCFDFTRQGGACKHMRALRSVIDGWVQAQQLHPFHFPTSLNEARMLATPQASVARNPEPPLLGTLTTGQSAVIANWEVLQAMANDQTDLDDIEEESSDGNHGGDSSDYDEPIGTGNFQQGVDLQIQQRVQHYVARLLPSMHGLLNLLDESSSLNSTPDLAEFSDVLQNLTSKIHRLHLEPLSQAVSAQTTLSSASICPDFGTIHHCSSSGSLIPQRRPQPLPPSPELAQKRKKSHRIF